MTFDLNVLESLRQYRKKKGISQAEAAACIGVARTTLSAIECGKRKLTPGELSKLLRLYAIDETMLLSADAAPNFKEAIFSCMAKLPLETSAIDLIKNRIEKACRTKQFFCRPQVGAVTLDSFSSPPEVVGKIAASQERSRTGRESAPIGGDLTLFLQVDAGISLSAWELPLSVCVCPPGFPPAVIVAKADLLSQERWAAVQGYALCLANITAEIEGAGDRENLFALSFARHFLMPPERLLKDINRADRSEPSSWYLLARYYGVPAKELVLFLELLGELPPNTWTKWAHLRALC